MKKFLKIFGLILIAALFIGTLVFLYKKSQKVPDKFEIKSALKKSIIKQGFLIYELKELQKE